MTANDRQIELDRNKPEVHKQEQQLVDEFFETTSSYWDEIYINDDLQSTIYRHRQANALRLLDDLKLPKDANVLEIGCGAGVLTVSIARRGYHVRAFDKVQAMKDLTDQRAKSVGLSDVISTSIEDVHDMKFPDQTFDVAFALGVLPWLHTPEKALYEMGRVLKPGGYLIVTVDNKWRLNHVFDPRFNPVVAPTREFIKSVLAGLKLRKPSSIPSLPQLHSSRQVDAMFSSIGLEKLNGFTLGFGPFMFFGRRYLSDSIGKKMNRMFQFLADHNVPGIRSTGSHYIIVGRRPIGNDKFFKYKKNGH